MIGNAGSRRPTQLEQATRPLVSDKSIRRTRHTHEFQDVAFAGEVMCQIFQECAFLAPGRHQARFPSREESVEFQYKGALEASPDLSFSFQALDAQFCVSQCLTDRKRRNYPIYSLHLSSAANVLHGDGPHSALVVPICPANVSV